jgi:hypothetical protein
MEIWTAETGPARPCTVKRFRLRDFAGWIKGGDVTSSTPAYMAPSNSPCEEVTVRSDIYRPAWCSRDLHR